MSFPLRLASYKLATTSDEDLPRDAGDAGSLRGAFSLLGENKCGKSSQIDLGGWPPRRELAANIDHASKYDNARGNDCAAAAESFLIICAEYNNSQVYAREVELGHFWRI